MTTKPAKPTGATVTDLPAARPPRTVKPVASAKAPAAAAPAAADVPVVRAKAPLKKKDFIDRAAGKSGIRKSDAKAAIEATLATLAEALAAGQELVLPPLGKLKVAKEKHGKNGVQLVLKLNLTKPDEPGAEPLAEAAE